MLARLVPSAPTASPEPVARLASATPSQAPVVPDQPRPPAEKPNPALLEPANVPAGNEAERDTAVVESPAPFAPRRANVSALREYYHDLGAATARFRRYPTEGIGAGVGGRTIFRLEVGAGGRPRALNLLSSSGHESLDRAALDMLRLAASHTPVPEGLQGEDFIIDLAVDFAPPSSE